MEFRTSAALIHYLDECEATAATRAAALKAYAQGKADELDKALAAARHDGELCNLATLGIEPGEVLPEPEKAEEPDPTTLAEVQAITEAFENENNPIPHEFEDYEDLPGDEWKYDPDED